MQNQYLFVYWPAYVVDCQRQLEFSLSEVNLITFKSTLCCCFRNKEVNMNEIMKLISIFTTLIVLCVCLCESGVINISIESADSYNTVGFSPHNCSYGNDNDYVFFNKKEVWKSRKCLYNLF